MTGADARTATSAIDPGAALPRPTAAAERIHALDLLRGMALLGIVLMNIPNWALPGAGPWHPPASGAATGIDWWAWFLSAVLIDGKARALFSILFGAGVILMTERAEASGPEGRARSADIYYRRTLWLMAFGLVDAYVLLWPGDIIYVYGLCGLVLFPFRRLPARSLIGLSATLILLTIVFGLFEHGMERANHDEVASIRSALAAGETITQEQQETLDDWNERLERDFPSAEDVAEEVASRRRGYLTVFCDLAPITKEIHSTPLYLETDVLCMMLLGMAFLRAGVITGARSVRFYATAAAVCLPVGWTIAALGPLAWSRSGFDPEFIDPLWAAAGWTYPTQRVLLVIGYIGVLMLWSRSGLLRPLQRAIAAAGRVPLTNYLAQSVIYMTLFSGVGFGLIGELRWRHLIIIAVAIWIAQMLLSVLWLRTHAFGPMEFLWRWLTYGRRPAWRRA